MAFRATLVRGLSLNLNATKTHQRPVQLAKIRVTSRSAGLMARNTIQKVANRLKLVFLILLKMRCLLVRIPRSDGFEIF